MSQAKIRFRCLEVEQPIGTFYIGAMSAQDLVAIAMADIRRIEDDDLGQVLGVQRELNPKRVREICEYVKAVDATFPTSVILAIGGDNALYNERTGEMTLDRSEGVAKIIDGQHRLAGLNGFTGKFDVNVTIFVDMDMEDQAMVFATINLAQTKVNKSLVYDLYEFARARSPQKTCHNIAKIMNIEDKSPFLHKIKILGKATGKPDETLTQAAFVEPLMAYITSDAMVDRNTLKAGKRLIPAADELSQKLIFRNAFIDKEDADIARNVWNYFTAVSDRWPDAWPRRTEGNILNRTTGFRALMRFLRPAYLEFARPGQIVSSSKFRSLFDRIRLGDDDFTPERFSPGTSGESALYRQLMENARLS